MSKKPSEDLFFLIKSMGRNEKGYFKKLVSLHTVGEKNNYVKLFDAIEKQEKYDEASISLKETYIRQLPLLKNYLYKSILDSLEGYYSKSIPEIRLRKIVSQIHLLYSKAMYSQCLKLIRSAKKLAYKYDKFAILVDILQLERTAIGNDLSFEIVDRLMKEEDSVLKKLNNLMQYLHINSRLYAMFRKIGHVRNEKDQEKIDLIVSHTLMSDERKALSFTALLNYLKIKALYYTISNKPQACFEYRNKLLALFEEKHPEFIEESPTQYIAALNNLAISCYALFRKKDFFQCLSKLHKLEQDLPESEVSAVKARAFLTSSGLELSWHFRSGDFAKGAGIIPAVERGMEIYKNKISKSSELELYLNIAKIYFGDARYDKALHWLNRLFNHEDISLLPELYYNTGKILNIITHYELGNSDFMDYLIKSTLRHMKNKKGKYELEFLMLKFFEVINKRTEKKVLKKHFFQLREKLQELKSNPFENTVLEHFDFLSWAESKIENKPLKEIFRKKIQKE